MLLLPEALVDWVPALLVLGIGWGIMPMLDRTSSPARLFMFAVAVVLAVRYLNWRLSETLPPLAWTWDAAASWSFAALEAAMVVSSLSAFTILSRYRDRTPEADSNLDWYAARPPSVAILIATYNEEWPVIERSIAGALACDYAAKKVYVLDDGRRDWLAERCRVAGIEHVTRPDNKDSKAGNINHMLARLRERPDRPDFVAVFDADFVPHRDFLVRTMALFHNPAVGLVQTPQHFFNPDPIQHNLGISRSYPDEQRFFFDCMEPSRDAWGIAVCCGTSSIVRWTALDAIGDFPTTSVTEDYLLTATLRMHGYSTVYLNEPLSEGLAPEGLREYITQRARWCLGLMQIVRGDAGPFSPKPLRFRDRWSVMDSCLYWLVTFPFKLGCIVYPLLYWYFGIVVMDAALGEIIAHFVPYYLAMKLFLNFISVRMFVPILNDISQLVGAWEISRSAITGLLFPRGHAFSVTAKGGDRSRIVVQWPLMWRFVVLFVLTVIGLTVGLVSDYFFEARAGEGKVVILFWTLYNLLVLAGTIIVCVELPRGASILRSRPERIRLVTAAGERMAWLTDIHQEALRLRGVHMPAGTGFIADVPGVGEVAAEVIVSFTATLDARLELSPEQRERLIHKLHTQAGAPGTGLVATARLGLNLVQRFIAGRVR